VPLAFAGYVGLSYNLALSQRDLPFLGQREWRWWVAFLIALAVGGACIIAAETNRAKLRTAVLLIYLLCMSAALAGLHIAVACHLGDCI